MQVAAKRVLVRQKHDQSSDCEFDYESFIQSRSGIFSRYRSPQLIHVVSIMFVPVTEADEGVIFAAAVTT